MANPAPAPMPGGADPSVQSSISTGGRRVKADVAMASLATGSKTSEDPVSEPRSWSKVTPLKPHHGGRPRAKLSRRESSSPKCSAISVAESRHDFRVGDLVLTDEKIARGRSVVYCTLVGRRSTRIMRQLLLRVDRRSED